MADDESAPGSPGERMTGPAPADGRAQLSGGPHGLISERYRLGELLGSGGSASVFAAVDVHDGATVALKILHPHLSRSVSAREAFFGEARAAQALQHPNIVAVLGYGVHAPDAGDGGVGQADVADAFAGADAFAPADVGADVADAFAADDPQAWIALEHVEGASLAELVEQRGRLPIAEALAVAEGVLNALEFAHAAGVVHRDVSPANVMLVRDPRGALRPSGVRLVDFGLADAAGRAALGANVLGGQRDAARRVGVVGNVNYLSPEQARGEPVDERGDLYQVGATLYFALVGRPPFVRSSRRAVMLAHLQAPPPVPSVLRPGLPRAIDRLVVKALLKDPAQRFPDATRMRAAVRTAAAHLAGADALLPDDFRVDGTAPGSGSPSALGASGTMVLPAPSSYAGPAGAAGTATGPGSAPRPDDTTQVLPTARSRRMAASAGASFPSGVPAGARSTSAWGAASGSTAPGRAAPSRTTSPNPTRSATGGSAGAGATPPPRGPLARGALALWCGVGVVALLVVGAWALASGSVPPSSFAAGSEQSAAPTAGPTTTPTPTATPSQAPTPAAAALVPVPVLQGSLAEARAALAAAGLTVGAVTLENAPRAADSVLSTSPVAGTTVTPGAVVDLTVASGSNVVPTVEGAAQDDAVTSIRAAGFDVVVTGRADAAPPGTVLQTLPAHGTVARLGSTVTVVVASPLPTTPPTSTATPTPTPTPTSTPPNPTPPAG